MGFTAMDELDDCMESCRRLEQLLQQDADEIALSVSGEICDVYVDSVNEAIETTKRLKSQIMLLRSC